MKVRASGGFQEPITGFTKLSNITAGKAEKREKHASSYARRASTAGLTLTSGGMKMAIVGIQIATGMTTIMIMTVITTRTEI
jgi:hypothetical protein